MDWDHFLELMDYFGSEVTGDGVAWNNPKINAVEMEEVIKEI